MTFERAFAVTIGEEGGESNHPADKGGHTYRGVTQRRFSAYLKAGNQEDRDVITMTDAELKTLAKLGYWNAAHCDAICFDRVANLHFDSAFNHGPANAIRLLQEAVGVEVDGAWGPQTEKAANIEDCFEMYLQMRKQFYAQIIKDDPSQAVFRDGWNNRLTHLLNVLG